MPVHAQDTPPQQKLVFEVVLQKAVQQSRQAQIAAMDVRISEKRIGEARAEYYPKLNARYSVARSLNLQDNGSAIVPTGDAGFTVGQDYVQNVLALQGQWTLFDFGIRKRQVQAAREDMGLYDAERKMRERDTAVKALDAYEQVWSAYESGKRLDQVLSWARDVMKLRQRLYDAGYTAKVDVAEAGYRVARILDELETTRGQLAKSLTDLGYLTKETYDVATVEIEPIAGEPLEAGVTLLAEQLPEYERYEREKAKKRLEIQISQRERWAPKITSTMNYYVVGSDTSNYDESLRALTARTFFVGLNAQLPIFEGFKTRHKVERLELELEKINLQQLQATEETLYKLEKAKRDAEIALAQQPLKEAVITQANEKEVMLERLNKQQLVERSQVLEQAIAKRRADIDLLKNTIQQQAALKRQQLLQMGAS